MEDAINNLLTKLESICEYYELHNKKADAMDLRQVIKEYHNEVGE